jgi:hypothetical protein
MVLNVVRTDRLLVTEHLFLTPRAKVAALRYQFWPPVRVIGADGRICYGIRWTTVGRDTECWIVDLPHKQTVAQLIANNDDAISTMYPVEWQTSGTDHSIFQKPLVLRQISDRQWTIELGTPSSRVALRVFGEDGLVGQVAVRLSLSACDLSLCWLWATKLAQSFPEFYWHPGA